MKIETIGKGLDGLKDSFDQAFNLVGDRIRYLEIGIGRGQTLEGIANALSKTDKNWILMGVDIPEQWEDFEANKVELTEQRVKQWWKGVIHATEVPALEKSSVALSLERSEPFLRECVRLGIKFNVIFIDGCHEGPCAAVDFVLSDMVLDPGGIIMVHDTHPACQDKDHQQHCKFPNRVKEAMAAMGLYDGRRADYKLLADRDLDFPGLLSVRKAS